MYVVMDVSTMHVCVVLPRALVSGYPCPVREQQEHVGIMLYHIPA